MRFTSEQKVHVREIGDGYFAKFLPSGEKDSLDLFEDGGFPKELPNQRVLESEVSTSQGITIKTNDLGRRSL